MFALLQPNKQQPRVHFRKTTFTNTISVRNFNNCLQQTVPVPFGNKTCVNCLKSGHTAKTCKSGWCMTYKNKHNCYFIWRVTLNHQTKDQQVKGIQEDIIIHCLSTWNNWTRFQWVTPCPPGISSLALSNGQESKLYVLLSTAVLQNKTDTMEIECRALLANKTT